MGSAGRLGANSYKIWQSMCQSEQRTVRAARSPPCLGELSHTFRQLFRLRWGRGPLFDPSIAAV